MLMVPTPNITLIAVTAGSRRVSTKRAKPIQVGNELTSTLLLTRIIRPMLWLKRAPQSTIALLKKLEMKNPKLARIFVVADNARYYRNRLVREFLKTSKIQILFLPPYSPNLNLIERLWRFFKKVVLYNQYYEKFADFRSAILHFFKNIKLYRTELSSLMTLKFHLLGA